MQSTTISFHVGAYAGIHPFDARFPYRLYLEERLSVRRRKRKRLVRDRALVPRLIRPNQD